MAVLANSKHERFCQNIAAGSNATKAYIAAGYAANGAQQSAARLLLNAVVRARVKELQETIAAGTIALEISDRSSRVRALQDRWNELRAKVRCLMTERGADMADVPGGSTGLLCRDYRRTKDTSTPVYKIDGGLCDLFAELRGLEEQAARELDQRKSLTEVTLASAGPPKSALPEWLLDDLRKAGSEKPN